MLRILVVDDETLVRVGIKSMIDWEEHGFTIVGEADNGERGYQMAKELSPDIVLMDIRMPKMDGIELIRLLRREELCTGIIVLSAYGDFDYVKKAMQYGADDYILKVDLEEKSLLAVLDMIRARIESAQQLHQPTREEKFYSENIGYLRRNYLRDAMRGSADLDRVREHLELLDMTLLDGPFRCISVELKKSMFFEQRSITKQDEQRLHNTIYNLFGEILRSYHGIYAADLDIFEYALLCSAPGDSQGHRKFYLELAGRIRDLMLEYVNTEVVVGVSVAQHNYASIPECVKQAQTAAEYAVVSATEHVVFYEDIAFDDIAQEQTLQDAVDLLEAAYTKMDINQISNAITNVMEVVRTAPRLSTEVVQENWHIIFYIYRKYLGSLLDMGSIDQQLYDRLAKKMRRQPRTRQDLLSSMAWLRRTSLMMVRPMRNSHVLIREIKEYIDGHYNEALQLEDIARRFSISSNYLCSLYKKITGQNFIEYITEVRIEHAKVLLQTTSIKIAEIGQMVGYDNIYYFSKVFKKVANDTPAAFRQKTSAMPAEGH